MNGDGRDFRFGINGARLLGAVLVDTVLVTNTGGTIGVLIISSK